MGKLPDFFLRKPQIFSALASGSLETLGFFFKDDYEKRIVGWWEYPGSKFEIRLEPWGALIFQEDTVKVDPWPFWQSRRPPFQPAGIGNSPSKKGV